MYKRQFQDTLGDFVARQPLDRRTVIHLDADLYSSTLYVLTTLAPKLRPGDVILFDELGSAYGVTHEFRALEDFAGSYRFHYRLLAGTRRYLQAAIEVDVYKRHARTSTKIFLCIVVS